MAQRPRNPEQAPVNQTPDRLLRNSQRQRRLSDAKGQSPPWEFFDQRYGLRQSVVWVFNFGRQVSGTIPFLNRLIRFAAGSPEWTILEGSSRMRT